MFDFHKSKGSVMQMNVSDILSRLLLFVIFWGMGSQSYADSAISDGLYSSAANYARSSVNGAGSVATIHPLATAAGLDVLERGGTAIDAAVAAAFTLGVVDNHNSGIGGGNFALIRYADGTVKAIDGREMAPAAAHHPLRGQTLRSKSRRAPLLGTAPAGRCQPERAQMGV